MDRERRRYRAHMPEAARKNGHEPRKRTSRKSATRDLAEGLGRYLWATGPTPTTIASNGAPEVLLLCKWAEWAVLLGNPYTPAGPAPDGTSWGVNTIIEYV